MAAHGEKAGVDDPGLAALDTINRGLHIVVDAAPGNAAKRFKRPGMGVKQHFVALGRISHQPECPAAGQLAVRHFQSSPQAADPGVLAAPVELECFALSKAQRHEGTSVRGIAKFLAQLPDTDTGSDITAGVAQCLDGLEHDLGRAAVPFRPMTVGFEPAA